MTARTFLLYATTVRVNDLPCTGGSWRWNQTRKEQTFPHEQGALMSVVMVTTRVKQRFLDVSRPSQRGALHPSGSLFLFTVLRGKLPFTTATTLLYVSRPMQGGTVAGSLQAVTLPAVTRPTCTSSGTGSRHARSPTAREALQTAIMPPDREPKDLSLFFEDLDHVQLTTKLRPESSFPCIQLSFGELYSNPLQPKPEEMK